MALLNQLLRTLQGKKLFMHGIALAGNVENSLLAGLGKFAFPRPKWPPDPPTPDFLDGPRVAAFDTSKESCAQIDIPDAAARAFRDYKGTVHLFAYKGPVPDPKAHVCAAVPYLDSTAINYHPASHLFVATLWNQGSASWGPQGVYFTTSPDFIHWSKPELAMTQNQMLRREPEGNWSYQILFAD